jgi:hypothetical protein
MNTLDAGRCRTGALPLLLAALVYFPAGGCTAGNLPAGTPVVEAAKTLPPPTWAPKQRELLELNAAFAREFDKAFLLPNGHLRGQILHGGGVSAPDDIMETLAKLPLLYCLGGDADLWRIWWKAWRGSIEQCTEMGLFANEMAKHLDWHHNGEHYQGFWLAARAAPNDPEYRRQALKFASFFDGTNPKVPNYDPEKKIIRSINCGGAGPVLKATRQDWDERGGEFWDDWLECGHDGPINLITTCFGTNAFLLTGQEKYRRRTLEYIDAWRQRAKANGGIMPSIVNRDGKVPDAWWGGVMGWNFRKFGGAFHVTAGSRAAWGNALLMTGDASYYDTLRTLADELWKHHEQKAVRGQTRYAVPVHYDGNQWYRKRTGDTGVYASVLANIYLATMRPADRDRLLKRAHSGIYAAGHAPWQEGGYERDWIAFLEGENPSWCQEELDRLIRATRRNVEAVRKEAAVPPDKRRKRGWPRHWSWAGPLVNQMTGGVMPLWHGQLLLCRFFYFDPERKRPGIPRDCAALVESMSDEAATLVLVNTSKTDARTVLVQTGAYAEHQCVSVRPEGGRDVPVDGTLFAVKLPPASAQRLHVAMKRYANTPALRTPWGT